MSGGEGAWGGMLVQRGSAPPWLLLWECSCQQTCKGTQGRRCQDGCYGHTTHAPPSLAPRGRRGWKKFYAVLKGTILYLQKVRFPQNLYPGRANSALAFWCPEHPGKGLGRSWILPHQGPDFGSPRALVVSEKGLLKGVSEE